MPTQYSFSPSLCLSLSLSFSLSLSLSRFLSSQKKSSLTVLSAGENSHRFIKAALNHICTANFRSHSEKVIQAPAMEHKVTTEESLYFMRIIPNVKVNIWHSPTRC